MINGRSNGAKAVLPPGVKSEASEFGQQFSPTMENSKNLFQLINILETQKCCNSLAAFFKTSRLRLNHKQPVAVAMQPKVIIKVTTMAGCGD